MIFFIYFLIFFVTLAIWWVLEDKRRCTSFPPGPPRIPVLGSLLSVAFKSNVPAIALAKLAKIYGDVMYVKIGLSDGVVFSSHEAAKEIFQLEKTNDRVIVGFIGTRNMNKDLGLVWSNGKVWKTLRRFTIRTLRDFGFGKSASMDVVINEEIDKFMTHFKKTLACSTNNTVLMSKELFDMTTTNVLWRLVTGISYDLEDDRIENMIRLSTDFLSSCSNGGDISITFPFLRDWFPEWTGLNQQKKCVKNLYEFMQETVRLHKNSKPYASDPQSFMDVFLAKIDENPNDPIFNDEQLIYTLLDLFQAGSDTNGNTLSFLLLYLVMHPHVQKKLHEELDAVILNGGVITAEMKFSLPFCTATMLETFRFSSLVSLTPYREATEDFQFRNYTIQKGTAIMINVQAIHYDEAVWGDPHVFRPERFLTKEGVIDKAKADLIVAFGGGRRVCLGQNLAESTVFMYFTTLLKSFKFEAVHGNFPPSLVPQLGLIYAPKPFEVKVVQR
ncbi:Farnesoate epoxidase [Orchesella cincta]|uniref:Farnesoate epoxidase n=1 Tax=Orchesella cincta TaxID=48709 RepID=A0A1D2MFV2_ORCCI|nr:Farnesoate epoxidase [Orchesella cincta]